MFLGCLKRLGGVRCYTSVVLTFRSLNSCMCDKGDREVHPPSVSVGRMSTRSVCGRLPNQGAPTMGGFIGAVSLLLAGGDAGTELWLSFVELDEQ